MAIATRSMSARPMISPGSAWERREPEPAPGTLGRESRGGGDREWLESRLDQPRDQGPGRKRPRADQAQARPSAVCSLHPARPRQLGCGRLPASVIAAALPITKHDSDGRPVGLQQLEGPFSLREGEAVGDELGRPHLALGDQAQEGFHVALLGPANLADRVVEPMELVVRVVAARPVGAGESQLELLLVQGRSRQLQANVADDHHPAPVAREGGRQQHRIVRFGGGADEHRIGGVLPARPRLEIRAHLGIGVRRARELDEVGAQVRRRGPDNPPLWQSGPSVGR